MKLEFNKNEIKYKKPKKEAEAYIGERKNYEIKSYIGIKLSLKNKEILKCEKNLLKTIIKFNSDKLFNPKN